jgi:hypothetical protein
MLAVTLSAAVFAACNDKPPARTVLDPQVEALDKARAVDGQVRDATERRKAQAEQPETVLPGY